MIVNQLQNLILFSYTTDLISGTAVILYGRICKSLAAVHALPTETPLCHANRRKDLTRRIFESVTDDVKFFLS
jgi:hypothetical protein